MNMSKTTVELVVFLVTASTLTVLTSIIPCSAEIVIDRVGVTLDTSEHCKRIVYAMY